MFHRENCSHQTVHCSNRDRKMFVLSVIESASLPHEVASIMLRIETLNISADIGEKASIHERLDK